MSFLPAFLSFPLCGALKTCVNGTTTFNTIPRTCYSTTITCPLSEAQFFHHDRETRVIMSRLKGPPHIHLYTGPQDSGKTTLLRRCLQDHSVRGHPATVCHLDLRECWVGSEEGFRERLRGELSSWLESILHSLRKLSAENAVNLDALGIPTSTLAIEAPPENFSELVSRFSRVLPNVTRLQGLLPTPVLFIDDCHELSRVLEDNVGRRSAFLRWFLRWLAGCVHTNHHFHVVFATTDCQFYRRLQAHISHTHFTTVVGHLSAGEAEKHWSWCLEALPLEARLGVQQRVAFQDVYEVCGGSIYLAQQFLQEHLVNPEEKPSTSSMVESSLSVLKWALLDGGSKTAYGTMRSWTRDDVEAVMKMLAFSEGGWISHEEVADELDLKVVDSLISHRVLYLRPTVRGAGDILDVPEGDTPIVTAASPCDLYAMKLLVNKSKFIYT